MARRGKHRRAQGGRNRNYRDRRADRQETVQRFLIVCEGSKTEPNYFRRFRVPELIVDVKNPSNNPRKLVDKALAVREQGEYDQVWCVFDRDDCDVGEFNSVIQRAESQGVHVAYSNQAFELWYLLHYHFYNAPMHRVDYAEKLSEQLSRTYRKNDIHMFDELHPMQSTAVRNAKLLLQQYSPRNPVTDDPSTTVHLLVRELNRFLPENRKNIA